MFAFDVKPTTAFIFVLNYIIAYCTVQKWYHFAPNKNTEQKMSLFQSYPQTKLYLILSQFI